MKIFIEQYGLGQSLSWAVFERYIFVYFQKNENKGDETEVSRTYKRGVFGSV